MQANKVRVRTCDGGWLRVYRCLFRYGGRAVAAAPKTTRPASGLRELAASLHASTEPFHLTVCADARPPATPLLARRRSPANAADEPTGSPLAMYGNRRASRARRRVSVRLAPPPSVRHGFPLVIDGPGEGCPTGQASTCKFAGQRAIRQSPDVRARALEPAAVAVTTAISGLRRPPGEFHESRMLVKRLCRAG